MGFFSGLILLLAVIVLVLVAFGIGFLVGAAVVAWVVDEAVPDVLERIKKRQDGISDTEEGDSSWME